MAIELKALKMPATVALGQTTLALTKGRRRHAPSLNVVTLAVRDLTAALEFYRDGLGLPGKIIDDQRSAMFEKYASATPVGRIASPADAGEAIVSLMSNGFVTGAILPVDGGLTLARSA